MYDGVGVIVVYFGRVIVLCGRGVHGFGTVCVCVCVSIVGGVCLVWGWCVCDV